MACEAATLAEALSAQFCGTDSRMALLALAGQLYLLTGITAAQAMEGAKCFGGMDDANLQQTVAVALCTGG